MAQPRKLVMIDILKIGATRLKRHSRLCKMNHVHLTDQVKGKYSGYSAHKISGSGIKDKRTIISDKQPYFGLGCIINDESFIPSSIHTQANSTTNSQ